MKFLIPLCLLPAASLFAASVASSGIDRSSMDLTCKPCQDFWRYANGGWIDRNPIPAQYSSWGTMSVIAEGNREKMRGILEAAAQNSFAKTGGNARKIGDLYSSCMDTAAIDKLGAQPLQPISIASQPSPR